jgi:hypothetical protein
MIAFLDHKSKCLFLASSAQVELSVIQIVVALKIILTELNHPSKQGELKVILSSCVSLMLMNLS